MVVGKGLREPIECRGLYIEFFHDHHIVAAGQSLEEFQIRLVQPGGKRPSGFEEFSPAAFAGNDGRVVFVLHCAGVAGFAFLFRGVVEADDLELPGQRLEIDLISSPRSDVHDHELAGRPAFHIEQRRGEPGSRVQMGKCHKENLVAGR